MDADFDRRDAALLRLLGLLSARDYAFTCITPASHERVLARDPHRRAGSLRDVFGWSRPFEPGALEPEILAALEAADALQPTPDGLKATVRVSSVRGRLFLHSAFPALAEQSVFLGPDTYRFVDAVLRELGAGAAPRRVLEIGAGAGAPGVLVKLAAPDAGVTLADVNPDALRLARINAAGAGAEVHVVRSDSTDAVRGEFDLIIANPPFLLDPQRRTYRHGGALHGAQTSLDWAEAGSRRLAPGGRLVLYTGTAVVEGRDRLEDELRARLADCAIAYREVDPDIFGEELATPAYDGVDRLAAVVAVISRRSGP